MKNKNAGYKEVRGKLGKIKTFEIGIKKNLIIWTGKKLRVFKNGKELI